MSLLHQIAETVSRLEMIQTEDRVLVAVSGGPDSVALLHVLQQLAPRWRMDLAVAHLNHGLRPVAALQEETLVRKLAQDHQVPYYMDQIQLDKRAGSLEERARRERYEFLTRTARMHGCTKIALGHQADDNAEALLLHLLRGSANQGLGGIPPVRDGWIIRPMIEVRRRAILSYLKEHGLPYMQDASNADTRYRRNRIRHRLLPMLQREFNGNIVDTLNRTAAICRDEEMWFRTHLDPMLESICAPATDQWLKLKIAPLIKAHPAIRRRLIREALRRWQGHLQRLTSAHIEDLMRLISFSPTRGRLDLPAGLVARCAAGHLEFFYCSDKSLYKEVDPPDYEYAIHSKSDLPTEIVIAAWGGKLQFNLGSPPSKEELTRRHSDRIWLDAEKLHFPLIIRNWHNGDRMRPLGMTGSQKLKEIFINAKVPPPDRRTLPLLICNNKVLWVVGLRRSQEALVSGDTREVLVVAWRLLEQPA
jgi:tRNA(Ile)-lysidine synthase